MIICVCCVHKWVFLFTMKKGYDNKEWSQHLIMGNIQ